MSRVFSVLVSVPVLATVKIRAASSEQAESLAGEKKFSRSDLELQEANYWAEMVFHDTKELDPTKENE